MSLHERLNMVVSVTMIGLALYFVIDLPTRLYTLSWFGQAFTVTASSRVVMVLLLGGLAFTGAGAVMRSHPELSLPYTVPFWVNATFTVMLAALTLSRLGTPLNWVLGLFVTGVLLWFTLLAEYYAFNPQSSFLRRLSKLWSQWVSYALLLAYATLLPQLAWPLWVKTGFISMLGWLLSMSILKTYTPPNRNLLRFGFIMGLGLGQLNWLLQYWALSDVGQGLVMLLIFYALCGLVIAWFQARLSHRLVFEYVALTSLSLWLIARFVG